MTLAYLIGHVIMQSLWQGLLVGSSFWLSSRFIGKNDPLGRYRLAGIHLLWLVAWAMITGHLFWQEHYIPETGRGFTASVISMVASISLEIRTEYFNALNDRDTVSPFLPALATFWAAGVCFFYMRLLPSFLFLFRLKNQGIVLPPEDWQSKTRLLSQQLGIRRKVHVTVSEAAIQPMTIGFFKPWIFIPASMVGLSPADLDMILLHELAHIKRADFLVNLIQHLLEILFFYHPVVWWLSSDMRRTREACCDDLAVDIAGDPYRYAIALTRVQQVVLTSNRLSMNLSAAPATLQARVERLFAQKIRSYSAAMLAILMTIFLSFGFFVFTQARQMEEVALEAFRSMSDGVLQLFYPKTDEQGNLLPIKGYLFHISTETQRADINNKLAEWRQQGIESTIHELRYEGNQIVSLHLTLKTGESGSTVKLNPFEGLTIYIDESKTTIATAYGPISVVDETGARTDTPTQAYVPAFSLSRLSDPDLKTELQPLYFINGEEVSRAKYLAVDLLQIEDFEQYEAAEAIEKYGPRGKNGAILIFLARPFDPASYVDDGSPKIDAAWITRNHGGLEPQVIYLDGRQVSREMLFSVPQSAVKSVANDPMGRKQASDPVTMAITTKHPEPASRD